jgi:hypothetical protein
MGLLEDASCVVTQLVKINKDCGVEEYFAVCDY